VPDAERARLAAEALARARADARARGNYPARPDMEQPIASAEPQIPDAEAQSPQSPSPGAEPQIPGTGPGFPAPPPARRRPRRDDPLPLNSAISGLLDQQGWRLAAATGSVFARWAEIVGPDLAAHTRPEGLSGGELTVTADSTAWATQVRLLAAQLVRRLNAELGDGTVRRVKVRGPAAPRQQGQWRVRGGRGPRDTYG
jgi:predicted nucleic acid-binding Zn ribbon protein